VRLARKATSSLLGTAKGENKNPPQIGGNNSPHRTHHTLPGLIFADAFMNEHDKSPWGNIAIFYKDFSYSGGLIKLGRIESGMDVLNVPGQMRATMELIDKD
jgi:hypothetical protein